MERKGVYASSTQSAFFTKLVHTKKLLKCKILKIQTKLPQNDGEMLDTVP